MSGQVEVNKEGGNGGPSTLRRMLRSRYPSLSQEEASELILKAREFHGGSLSGMKMCQIEKTIKTLMKAKMRHSNEDQLDMKDKHDDLTGGDDRTTEKNEIYNKKTGNEKTKEIIKENENEDDTFKKTCKFCFKMFLHRKTCREHMLLAHTYTHSSGGGVIDLKEACEKKVQKSVDDNVLKYKCRFCDKKFLYSYTLNRHMEKHEKVPQLFKCRFCDKSFRRKDILRRHEQIMHRSYQIDFTAAGQASTDSLKCKMCSQDFGDNKESFFAHLSAKACQRKTNSFKLDEEHRFECNVCTKKYLDRDSLVKHIRWKHRDKEEFNCNMCSSKFQHKSSLVRHSKKIHAID